MKLRRQAPPAEVPESLRVFIPEDWHPEMAVAVLRWQKARHDWLDAHPGADVLAFLRAGLAERRRVICTDL